MKDGKHVILCIDDDQDFLDALSLVLESGDYVIQTAGSAEEGLHSYKAERPDMVLVDLMMEEVDAGVAFVKDIQALGDPPPVMMLSSVGDDLNLSTDYSEIGLGGVLQKPIEPKTLLSTIKAKLG